MSNWNTDDDPFAETTRSPSLSFKDKPVGHTYVGVVAEPPRKVQARNFETGEPDAWPDGNPKYTVAVNLKVDNEIRTLWAPIPSAMFRAIADAQKEAGQKITPGGTLHVRFTGEEPNKKNPRLHPAKQYVVMYQPPDPFADTTPARDDKPPF